jgi:hypothetical protein
MSTRGRAWVCLVLLTIWGGSALRGDSQQRRPPVSHAQVGRTIRELRRAAISPPTTMQASSDLEEAVRRVQALRLGAQEARPAETATSRPAASQPASAPAVAPETGQVGPLRPYVLQQIVKLPPREVVDAAALAEALFLAGRARAAYAFYELALKSAEEPASQAWLLYQMGNCQRAYDPAGARQTYRRLAAEHAESAWVPLAAVQDQLIEWFRLNNPEGLLAAVEAASRQEQGQSEPGSARPAEPAAPGKR